MTDQREKRIQEIQGFLEVSWRYAEDGVTMEGYQEDVAYLLTELSRLQVERDELRSLLDPDDMSKVIVDKSELEGLRVERDKAIEALRKLSEVVPNALALEEVRDLL